MRPAFGVAVLALILVALVLRILMMAPSYAFPGGDELGYLSDGLLVLEGITPGYKFAPAGLLTWFSFVYGGVAAAGHVLAPSAFVAGLPGSLKLLGAFDSGLFAIYRDMSDLHFWVVVAVMLVSLGGVFAAARLGHKRAGFAGLLVAGGLMAALPIVVSLSVQSRPYALAWSLALMAIGFAGLADGRLRSIGAGICFGLAVSSRIDIATIFPLILWEFWWRRPAEGLARPLARLIGAATISFMVAAPWYLSHLLGNLRVIATVRVLHATTSFDWETVSAIAWQEGLGPLCVLLAVGLLIRAGDDLRKILALLGYLAVLLVSALYGTKYGLRHQGTLIVASIAVAPLALDGIVRHVSKHGAILAIVISIAVLALPVARTIEAIATERASWANDRAVEWIETNLPSGSIVYLQPHFAMPLPTRQSGDDLWDEVAGSDAWRRKLASGLAALRLPATAFPRALSEEHLYQERGNRRRYFILAGDHGGKRPRFDLRLISLGSPFDYTPAAALTRAQQEGGYILWRGEAVKEYGNPMASWLAPDGSGVFIYGFGVAAPANR